MLFGNVSARTLEKVVRRLHPSTGELAAASTSVEGLGEFDPAVCLGARRAEASAFHRTWAIRAGYVAALRLAGVGTRGRAG